MEIMPLPYPFNTIQALWQITKTVPIPFITKDKLMKTIHFNPNYRTALALLLLFVGVQLSAQTNTDKTGSPYFKVLGESVVDGLPLLHTGVNVNVTGVIADVTVTQVYKNEGTVPLEAVYVFPASTQAAIYGLEMDVAGKKITAVIKGRDEARKDYETAKNQGKSATLLEQERPNVFTMNVANILPGEAIHVTLRYTEPDGTQREIEASGFEAVATRFDLEGRPRCTGGRCAPSAADVALKA